MSTPTVSVLVTVFNREAFLAACLDSILSSTYQDFEVVVVDDGSKDGSVAIARLYATRDPRVRVYQNEQNLGDYPNRNRAAELATGRYLKYVDADDLIYPHGLEVMVKAMEEFPEAGVGLALNCTDPERPYPFQTTSDQAIRRHFLGRSLFGCGPTGAIIRREAFNEAGGFSGRPFTGDSELWIKLAERRPLVSLPPALVWWRRHEGQQMHLEMERPEVVNARLALQEQALKETCHLDEKEKSAARAVLRQHHARRLLSLAIGHRRFGVSWRLFRDSGLGASELLGGFLKYR
jgi:glycosyltransferase involved in cell wall biosynthesis